MYFRVCKTWDCKVIRVRIAWSIMFLLLTLSRIGILIATFILWICNLTPYLDTD